MKPIMPRKCDNNKHNYKLFLHNKKERKKHRFVDFLKLNEQWVSNIEYNNLQHHTLWNYY